MKITFGEINDFLIPRLDWFRLGIKHCKNPKCEKALNETQDWLDTLKAVEQAEQKKLFHSPINRSKGYSGKP